jgi:DNA-directed RNA polymerase subunit alpha
VDAVAYASRILQDQLNIFITFDEPARKAMVGMGMGMGSAGAAGEEGKPDLPFNPALLKKVTSWSWSVRSANCLKNDTSSTSAT